MDAKNEEVTGIGQLLKTTKVRAKLPLLIVCALAVFALSNDAYAGYSVQSGRIEVTDAIVDVPVTAVSDVNEAFVLISLGSGYDSNDTNANVVDVRGYLESADNIRLQRTTSDQSSWVSYQIIECTNNEFTAYRGSGSLDINDLSKVIDIGGTVEPANCLAYVTADNDSASMSYYNQSMLTARVSSDSQLTIERLASGNVCPNFNWIVVAFKSNKVGSVQHGSVLVNGRSHILPEIVSINTIDANNSVLIFQTRPTGNTLPQTAIAGNIESPTQIKFYQHDPVGYAGIEWYVIDFGDGAAQRGVVDYSADSTWVAADVNMSPAIDTSQTMSFHSLTCDGPGDDYPTSRATAEFTSSDNLRIERKKGGQGSYIEWQVLELAASDYINYTISGTIGLAGVTMDGLGVVTDSNGDYIARVDSGFSGTVTPIKTGYTFDPNSSVYDNVTADFIGEDYTPTQLMYIISGQIVDSNTDPVAGVEMTGLGVVTDVNGNYTTTEPYGFSGTVTPSKFAYIFDPNSSVYTNVTSDQTDANYLATLIPGPPIASNVSTSAHHHQTISIELDAIDEGLVGPLSYIITSLPSNGTLSDPNAGQIDTPDYVLADNGALVNYTCDVDYICTDSFSFQADDGGSEPNGGLSNEADVSVSVAAYFTELFDSNDNDLDNQMVSFIPDGSPIFYSLCRDTADGFLTDPCGGTVLPLADNDYAQVNLTGGKQVGIYGSFYDSFYVSSNGYITFEAGDSGAIETLGNHYSANRVSALFDDLDPSATGTVSFKQLDNMVAVTFEAVPEQGEANSNSFQIEMFFNGIICLTYLNVDASDGLAGISDGGGEPVGFVESDFSGVALCSDLNKDYIVDINDIRILSEHWLGTDYLANLDRADLVDLFDFAWLFQYWLDEQSMTISGSAGLADVNMVGLNIMTDIDGFYSKTVEHGFSGIITPEKSGYTFIPADREYNNLQSTLTGQDYTAIINTFTISGSVGLADVNMAGLGVMTDGDGNYTAVVNCGFTGTVIPEKVGYTFVPHSATYIDVDENQTQDYVAIPAPYSIYGYVTDSNDDPLADVNMSGLDVFTDVDGYYIRVVYYGFSATVIPQKAGYSFDPPSIVYSDVNDNHIQDYTAALNSYTISGSAGLADVNMTGLGVTTDGDGNYAVVVDYGFSGTVTPIKTGYNFTPPSTLYDGVDENKVQDYIPAIITYTISGSVGLADVNMTGLGVTTDGDGNYVGVVNYGFSGTVTPVKTGYTFNPSSILYDGVYENKTGDYTAIINTYTISGSVGLADVNMTGLGVMTDGDGNYAAVVNYGFNSTVTPVKTGYTFDPPSTEYTGVDENKVQDYTAALNSYTISGSVGLADVNMAGLGVMSDGDGNYAAVVNYGFSGTVTPVKTGYTFSPPSTEYTGVDENKVQDYTAIINTYTISGYVGLADVNMTGLGVMTDVDGNYAAVVNYGFSGTVVPEKSGYSFDPNSRVYSFVIGDHTGDDYIATPTTPPVEESSVFYSIASEDGRLWDNGDGFGYLADANDAGIAALRLGDYQEKGYRSLLSFDLSSLPADATITYAKLTLTRGYNNYQDNPFNWGGKCLVDIANPYFGYRAALDVNDYQAPATAYEAGYFPDPCDGLVIESEIDSNSLSYINTSGKTQFKIYFENPDNNNTNIDYIGYYSANNEEVGNHPTLEIVYNTRMPTVEFDGLANEDGRVVAEFNDVSQSWEGSVTNSDDSDQWALRLGDYQDVSSYRDIVSFDTSSIPDNSTILLAKLQLYRSGGDGDDPFTGWGGACLVDIASPSFGLSTLDPNDWQTTADANEVAYFEDPGGVGPMMSEEFNLDGRNNINKTGTTQMRIYFENPINNLPSTPATNRLYFYSGEYAEADKHPKLIIQYSF